jgi:chromosome segregation ATPase
MSEIQEATQTLEESEEQLTQLLGILGLAYDEIESFCSEMESENKASMQKSEEISSHLTELYELVQASQNTLDNSELDTALDAFQTLLDETETELESLNQSIETLSDEFTTSLEEGETQIETEAKEAESLFEAINQTVDNLEDTIETGQQEVQAAFDTLEEKIDELVGNIENWQETTTQTFNEFISEVGETHSEALDTGFHELIDRVSENCSKELESGFEATIAQLEETYQSFQKHVTDTSEKFKTESIDILSRLDREIKETFETELDTMENELQSIINEVRDEIMENLALMTLGATTTAAIAPLILSIVWAIEIIKWIQEKLDELMD